MADYELSPGEPHPAALDAMAWLQKIPLPELFIWQEAFASMAIEDSRLAEICLSTLDRVLSGKPVSDRYLLGLAWTVNYPALKSEACEKQAWVDQPKP